MSPACANVARAIVLESRALLGVAEREQQLAAHPVVDRRRELARAQRRAVVLGGLLPGEQPVGAPRGGEREVRRALRLLDRRCLLEVMSELR